MVFTGYKKVTSLISLLWQTVTVGTMMFLLIGTPTTAWAQIDTNTFETKVDFTAGDQPWAMAIGDLDGDGKPDMAVANRVDNTVLLYLNTSSSGSISSGSFGTPSSISVGSGAPRGVDIYDIDGDGSKDLIVSNFDTNTLSVYRNTSSTGSISFASNVDLSATSGPWGMAFGDVDGDGKPDIAVANRGTTKISVFRNTSSVGSISFASKSDVTTGSGPFNVALGDLDGDGKLDMVTGNRNDNDMSVHRNTSSVGSISFASKVDFTTAGNPAFAAIGDVDGDGKAEVLIANSGSSSISVYHNTASSGSISSGSFASKVDFSVGSSPTGIVVVDLDGDGKLDLGVNNANSDNISVLRNTASSGSITSSSFATKVDFTAGDAPRKIVASDIDGDTSIDLIVVNSNSDNASVFRSTLSDVDTEAPTVSSIVVSGSPVASATSVDFEVTFSESVTGVDISDFSVDGTGVTGTISSISGSGDTYTVTVSSVSGIGTLSIDLNSSGTGIEDAASNAIETGFTGGATHTVDTESPEVTSITVNGSPSETDVSIDFDVTFSESVTGVDISDFSLDASGATATISGFSGSGTSYTVAVNSIRGDGTLSIDLNDSGTGIEDGDTNAITDGFTDGGTHTVNTLPMASSVSFSGTLEEGETLSGSYTYSGGYTESGTTYQWYRSDDGSGSNKAAISGATSSTYLVSSDDYGKFMSFEVTPSDGTDNGTAEESALQGAVLDPFADNPQLVSGYKESNTRIHVGFDQVVQTNGGNPTDFTVTDARGTNFAVSAQADGTAGDYYIRLTVANMSSAIGDLTVRYTNNNNNEITNLNNAIVPTNSSGVQVLNTNGYDLAQASYVQRFSVSSQEIFPEGVVFGAAGSKMFIIGSNGDDVNEYDLSAGYNVSTASYVQSFSVSSQEGGPSDIAFNPEGTKMFIVGFSGDEINEYSLSTAFDVSTASYTQNFSLPQDEFPHGLAFNPTGTKMYTIGTESDKVYEYSLGTGYDVSTASYVRSFSTSGQESTPTDVDFNTSGTKMYVVGISSDKVHEYSLSTGFNISTASYVQSFSVSSQESSPTGIAFNPNGSKMYVVGTFGDDVNEYDLVDRVAPSLSSGQITAATTVKVTFSEAVAALGSNPGDFTLTDSQATPFAVTGIADATPDDTELELTVADITAAVGALTLTYTNTNGEVTDYNNNPLATNETGVMLEYIAPTIIEAGITGTLEFWESLTASYTYSGENAESGSTFQWYRSEDSEGTGKGVISGATSLTYTLQVEDIGKYISVEVTPSDGTDTGTPVESALFGPVENMRVDTLTITGNEGWRMMSSPGDGASFDSLLSGIWTQGFTGANTTNGSPNVLLWDETTRSWSAPNDAADVPAPGVGFLVYVFDDDDYNGEGDGFPKVLDTNHYQNLGETTPSLSFTNTDSLAGDGWNLVGNPYATPLDWDAGNGWTRTNVDNTVYVWSDSANSGTGAYLTWNNLTGTLSDGIISPWQGFWVKANAAAPVITFTDSVRSTTDAVYLKQAPASELRLTLAGNGKSNQAIIMFGDGASLAKDPLDAYKLVPLKAGFLSVGTSLKKQSAVMDIQALPAVVEENIELGVSIDGNDLNGEFTLSWASPSLPEGWNVYLMDRKREQITDMKSEEAYTFSLDGPVYKQGEEINAMALLPRPKLLQAEPEQRFTLVVTNGKVLTNEWFRDFPTEVELNQNYPNPFNPSTTIQFGLPEQSAVSLEVFDILGRKVATLLNKETRTAGRHSIRFDGRALASGVYLYRLRAGKSVIIKKLTLIK